MQVRDLVNQNIRMKPWNHTRSPSRASPGTETCEESLVFPCRISITKKTWIKYIPCTYVLLSGSHPGEALWTSFYWWQWRENWLLGQKMQAIRLLQKKKQIRRKATTERNFWMRICLTLPIAEGDDRCTDSELHPLRLLPPIYRLQVMDGFSQGQDGTIANGSGDLAASLHVPLLI